MSRGIGRTHELCETGAGRNFARITGIGEIVMCFSAASALDIVSRLVAEVDSLEISIISEVGAFARPSETVVCID